MEGAAAARAGADEQPQARQQRAAEEQDDGDDDVAASDAIRSGRSARSPRRGMLHPARCALAGATLQRYRTHDVPSSSPASSPGALPPAVLELLLDLVRPRCPAGGRRGCTASGSVLMPLAQAAGLPGDLRQPRLQVASAACARTCFQTAAR